MFDVLSLSTLLVNFYNNVYCIFILSINCSQKKNDDYNAKISYKKNVPDSLYYCSKRITLKT